MKMFKSELVEKAKEAKNAEELIAVAKENDVSITEDEAKEYFNRLHPVNGELSDNELDNVAGGGCQKFNYVNGMRVIKNINENNCTGEQFSYPYVCKYCNVTATPTTNDPGWLYFVVEHKTGCAATGDQSCKSCKYLVNQDGVYCCSFYKG